MEKPYKKTEKWWLILSVLFYVLYNLPGIPGYGNSAGALWHGVLTLIPLWIIIYAGLFKIQRQRKLEKTVIIPENVPETNQAKKGEE